MLLLIRKLCWKESQPKFHAPIKWGTKLAIKRKKREEEECKKKNEIDSQKSPKLLYSTQTPRRQRRQLNPRCIFALNKSLPVESIV